MRLNRKVNRRTGMLYAGEIRPEGQILPDASPIYHATAYEAADLDAYEQMSSGQRSPTYLYSRSANPNRDELAEAISYLENGDSSYICASGMAAISTSFMALLSQGDHVLANSALYGETMLLLSHVLARFGVSASYVDFTRIEEVKAALRPNTKILYTEIITNPLIEVVDIEAIAAIAHEHQAKLVIDSTFTTPQVIQPLDFGADLVLHSLTKFIGGHNDVTAGSITGREELMKQIRYTYLFMGGVADANSCWLALRSVRTLEMRMQRHLDNAAAVAAALAAHPLVRSVHHPSLSTHPQHELAQRIFKNGFGPMLSFRVEDDKEKVNAFIRELKMIKYLGTLGGFRTSLAHPATGFRRAFTPEQLAEQGLYEGLIRISVGVEDAQDIIADITDALTVFA